MGEDGKGAEMVVYLDGVPCTGITTAEITAASDEELQEYAQHGAMEFSASASVVFTAVVEMFQRAIVEATTALGAIVAAVHAADEWDKALAAAERERPKWAYIYKHTKKARIRKKYIGRIMRWYLEEAGE